MTGSATSPREPLDGSGFRFAIVASRFNGDITERLVDGALAFFEEHGAPGVDVVWVPGAFELPLVCRELARAGTDPAARGARGLDGIVALGCVIRGETAHFEYVAGAAARGLMQVTLETGVPVAFGVLTTEDRAQAEARAGGTRGHKGRDAAAGAIEMAMLLSGKGPRGR